MANGGFINQRVKLTVVRMLKFDDIALEYGQFRPGQDDGGVIPSCPFFKEGDEFIVKLDPIKTSKPEGFCDWAWADLWKDILMVANKAGMAEPSEKSKLDPQFTCCTDGLRPVIFCVQSLEED